MRFIFLCPVLDHHSRPALRYLSEWASHLSQHQHHVSFFANRPARALSHSKIKCHMAAPGASTMQICASSLNWVLRQPPADFLITLGDSAAVATLAAGIRRLSLRPPRLIQLISHLSPSHSYLRHTVEAGALRASDAILTFGHEMREQLLRLHRITACTDRVHAIYPWACGQTIRPVDRLTNPLIKELGLTTTFNVLCRAPATGQMDISTIARAIDLTSTDRSIKWVIAAESQQYRAVRQHIPARHRENLVRLRKPERYREADLLALGDAHVLSHLPEYRGVAFPHELINVMAAGKPVMMVSPEDSEYARLVREHKAGLVIPSGRAEVLARSAWQLRDNGIMRQVYSRSGRFSFERYFEASHILALLDQLVCSIIQEKSCASRC
jgi:hypothetical protein